ncbi:hypothetical protein AVEN_70381-1 [Araneus ventricosus]|uniref:Uncharacterized protein n=1 Tax=Araneus ventricosus TaxID=182803 RepID=A0A4Y2MDI9_ARAVE|nr:hypothetical protein AVEN_70381-1 [Araneus ventricosus]
MKAAISQEQSHAISPPLHPMDPELIYTVAQQNNTRLRRRPGGELQQMEPIRRIPSLKKSDGNLKKNHPSIDPAELACYLNAPLSGIRAQKSNMKALR